MQVRGEFSHMGCPWAVRAAVRPLRSEAERTPAPPASGGGGVLGLGSWGRRGDWVLGLEVSQRAGSWVLGLGAAGGRTLEYEVNKNKEKNRRGTRQNCNFRSFLRPKIPAEHLHISGTLASDVGFCLTSPIFSVTTLNYRYIWGARSARQFF